MGGRLTCAGLTRQDGDAGAYWFSQFERAAASRQLPCYLTWAGAEVKEIIQRHLSESALYGGAISGRGPRYCPSVEDKVVRFPDAVRHQVFLEPEGLDTAELYVNGLSTSLPAAVQLAFLRAVPGLESGRDDPRRATPSSTTTSPRPSCSPRSSPGRSRGCSSPGR